MANIFYERGWIEINRTDLDLLVDTIRVALVDNTYVPNATTDEFFDDISGEISGGGYSSGGEVLTGKSIDVDIGARAGRFKADNITTWITATFQNAQAAIIYNDTGVASTSALIAYVDFVNTKNAPFNLNWNVAGIFIVNSQGFTPDQEATMETGDLSQFNSIVGNLSATSAAALAGIWGMEIDTTPGATSRANLTNPTDELAFTMQTLFDPNSLGMAGGDLFSIFQALGSGTSSNTIRMNMGFDGIDYEIELLAFLDSGGSVFTSPIDIVDISQKIRILWVASSGPGNDDGFALYYIDGILIAILETLDNDTYDIDTTRYGATAGLDAGTSGVFYMDNCLWSSQIILPNPLAIDFDMPTNAGIGFDITIVNAIGFTNIPNVSIQLQVIALGLARPDIVTPGLAEYKVRLKDQDGAVVAEFDTWRSLNFTHKVNRRGTIRFEINGQDDRINLFDLDGQLEVWRRNPIVNLDWYLEWEGFYRTNNDMFFQNDSNSFIAYGFSYMDLLRRAYIMYFAGTAQATKNALAETVMKEFVNENIGTLALISNGRQADNVLSGLTTQADIGAGATWEGSVENQKLMDVLSKISTFTFQQDEPVDFDIEGTGPATFQFRTYSGQRGTDRTKNNAAGNSAIIFSTGFGNMVIPVLKENRSQEITAAYALGRGVGDAQQIQLAESLALNDSPWNRIEIISKLSSPSGEDQIGQLLTGARAILEKNKFDPQLGFNVLQLEGTYYGKDYTWGDRTTAVFKTQEFNKKLVDIGITVSDNVGGEKIELTFADI